MLGNPQVRDLLDFGQPVGIISICMLHCLWDKEDPWGVVRRFRDAVVPGSYLALSHMTNETPEQAAQAVFQMTQDLHWNTPLVSRSRADMARSFDRFTLVAARPRDFRAVAAGPAQSPPEGRQRARAQADVPGTRP